MGFAFLIPWVFLASLVAAQAYDYGVDVDIQNLIRRSNEDEPIVVGQLPLRDDGSVPVRLEIRDLRKNRYKWDLYILALNMFQHVSQDNPTSWYQIAGTLHYMR
jgi:tyrosinase